MLRTRPGATGMPPLAGLLLEIDYLIVREGAPGLRAPRSAALSRCRTLWGF